jgi:hypothetical protein
MPSSPPAGSAYSAAGVDIDRANDSVALIKQAVARTMTPGVISGVGGFGAMYQLAGYREPVLVSSTDGVGTKLKVAIEAGRLDTVGIDLVNHCVNDILTCGARPLFFLDYIGLGKLVPAEVADIVRGMATACETVGCALIGGETAEMPGLYQPGDFDLVGFIVGAVERAEAIDGRRDIRPGDALLALPSSGLHTNGYSLVRRVFEGLPLDRYMPELGPRWPRSCWSRTAATWPTCWSCAAGCRSRAWPTSPAGASSTTCRASCPKAAAPPSAPARGRRRPSSTSSASACPRRSAGRCSTWASAW